MSKRNRIQFIAEHSDEEEMLPRNKRFVKTNVRNKRKKTANPTTASKFNGLFDDLGPLGKLLPESGKRKKTKSKVNFC